MLYRLVYVSKVHANKSIDMEKILRSALDFNKKNHVTGALWFDGEYFIQLLEGTVETLNHIFEHRIATASSHIDITLVCLKPCQQRVFSDWSMAYLSENSQQLETAQKFMAEKNLNPTECSSDDLVNLLCFLEDDRQRSIQKAIF